MKANKKTHNFFRRTTALLLSLLSTGSLMAAAAPAVQETFRSTAIEDALTVEPLWGNTDSASTTTKQSIIDGMNLTVDFAPQQYVAEKWGGNKTKYFPEKSDLKGYKTSGNTGDHDWYYRSMRWWYYDENREYDPLMPYKETEDRVDHYWHGNWKRYPDRSWDWDTFLYDCDAWFKLVQPKDENYVIISARKDNQGVDDGEGTKYNTGFVTAPARYYITVPANTTYRIKLKFEMELRVQSGEYSYAIMTGDCDEELTETSLTPTYGAAICGAHTLKYRHFEDCTNKILAYDFVPTSSNSEAASAPKTKSATLELTLTNTSNETQTFMRTFYLVMSHAPDYAHTETDNLNATLDGKLTVSISDVNYTLEAVELEDEEEETSQSTAFQAEIGSRSSSADGTKLDYGITAECKTETYLGYYGNSNTALLSYAYGSSKTGTVTMCDNELTIRHPAQVDGTYANYIMACVPVKVSTTIPAYTTADVKYQLDLKLNDLPLGEYIVGVMNGAANSVLQSTDTGVSDLTGAANAYYASNAIADISGKTSTNSLLYLKNQQEGLSDDTRKKERNGL